MKRRLALLYFCALLIGAHFLRSGGLFAVSACLAYPFLLLIRRRWSLRLVQALTWGASLLWLLTAARIAGERMEAGRPWLRMAAILATVAALTAFSAWFLGSGEAARRGINEEEV